VKKRSKDHAERERRVNRAEAGPVPADAREARCPSADAARAVNRQARARGKPKRPSARRPPKRTATPGLMYSSHRRLCC